MRGGSPVFLLFIVVFLGIIDLYSFRGIRILTVNLEPWLKLVVHSVFWAIPVVVLVTMLIVSLNIQESVTTKKFKTLYFLIGFFILFYAPKLVFILFQIGNDLFRLVGYAFARLGASGSGLAEAGTSMSRAEFLTKIGVVLAAVPFLSVIQGIRKGRFNYKVKKIPLRFENLPASFNGFKVLQISDWHIGSFIGHLDKVEEAVELINQQEADVILFTGDMVNNVADEMLDFIPTLKKLKAKYGVYSILGNHDYGEYVSWESKDEHKRNMLNLFDYQNQSGFKLLRNESILIEKEGDSIGVAGVENWGIPPFPQYGDVDKALSSLGNTPFKILMSHDPSHWDEEILQKDVDLTLSGHTHGMQFGINIPGIKWSPVKWKYPRWQGLYEVGKQKLFVSIGIGYIAFPGRVGFLPEIAVFELQKT